MSPRLEIHWYSNILFISLCLLISLGISNFSTYFSFFLLSRFHPTFSLFLSEMYYTYIRRVHAGLAGWLAGRTVMLAGIYLLSDNASSFFADHICIRCVRVSELLLYSKTCLSIHVYTHTLPAMVCMRVIVPRYLVASSICFLWSVCMQQSYKAHAHRKLCTYVV